MTNLFFVQFCAGSIPASLGNLGKLTLLYLHGNQLTGHSPPFFRGGQCRMTNLFFVEFYAGIIPESLGNLGNLQLLGLSGNQLSGQFYFYFSGCSVPHDHLVFADFLLPYSSKTPGSDTRASTNPSCLSSSSITDTKAANASLKKCLPKCIIWV